MKGNRQQPPYQIQEHCSNGAPFRDSTNWSCSGCSTRRTSSLRTWRAWNASAAKKQVWDLNHLRTMVVL